MRLQGNKIEKLTPRGWAIARNGFAQGDLNKDSFEDWAIVFEPADKTSPARERVLVVAFGSESGNYRPVLANRRFVLTPEKTAGKKDPFDGIDILNRSIRVDFSGSANWNWESSFTFRYDNHDFFLIGSEHVSSQASNADNEFHLVTYYPASRYEVTKPFKGRQYKTLERAPKLRLRDVGPARSFEPHVELEGLSHTK